MVVTKPFESVAKINAKVEGLGNISLAVIQLTSIPLSEEIAATNLGGKVAEQIRMAFSAASSDSATQNAEDSGEPLFFNGETYPQALVEMEKFFLQHGWSDGFPLIPPTEEAVNEMCQGTDLPRDFVVGIVEPGQGKATVEKIAINAAMAGCLPTYMPLIIAAVQAITDPKFDLRGVQLTTGMVSPFLLVSGKKLIREIGINDSFSSIGPGWRANSTTGRAIRLIMMNLGHSWPGKTDMKGFGSPFKFVMLFAENEDAYRDFWEPIRINEGFNSDHCTISVMPAVTWQTIRVRSDMSTPEKVLEIISHQGKAKSDKYADNWGLDNLIIVSPTIYQVFLKAKMTRAEMQQRLCDLITIPAHEFFFEKEPSANINLVNPLPEWLVQRGLQDSNALVPLISGPEKLKICVAGAPGTGMVAYVSTWGLGPSHFVTKEIRLPARWESLLKKYNDWVSPTIKVEN